jgi:hypothetical protein
MHQSRLRPNKSVFTNAGGFQVAEGATAKQDANGNWVNALVFSQQLPIATLQRFGRTNVLHLQTLLKQSRVKHLARKMYQEGI